MKKNICGFESLKFLNRSCWVALLNFFYYNFSKCMILNFCRVFLWMYNFVVKKKPYFSLILKNCFKSIKFTLNFFSPVYLVNIKNLSTRTIFVTLFKYRNTWQLLLFVNVLGWNKQSNHCKCTAATVFTKW